MASSDQGLVRRVTMALYIRFFSLSLKKISSISLSQKTPFLARSGEQGPVGMAHCPAEQAVPARRVSRAQGTSQRSTSVSRCQAHRAHLPAVGKHLLGGFLDFCFF